MLFNGLVIKIFMLIVIIILLKEYVTDVDREGARFVEQAVIDTYGIGKKVVYYQIKLTALE